MEFATETVDAFCKVMNQLKKTGYTAESIQLDAFLGGDLGIDSVEMLEIWFDLEKHFNIHIDDSKKRNIHTVEEVCQVVESCMEKSA